MLLREGIDCTIFEKYEDVGGCWRKNYVDFGLQVPRDLFEFAGFPYPSDHKWDLFPKGEQVYKYIRLYCEKYDLFKKCKFKCPVTSISRKPNVRGWTVKAKPEDGEAIEEHFDF